MEVGDVAHLAGMVAIAFQTPVGWGGQHEMDTARVERARMPRIAAFEGVAGGHPADRGDDRVGEFRIPGNPGQIGLEVGELESWGDKGIELQPAPQVLERRWSIGFPGGAHRVPARQSVTAARSEHADCSGGLRGWKSPEGSTVGSHDKDHHALLAGATTAGATTTGVA